MKPIYTHTAVITCLLLLCAYEHGIRIADISEVPNSERPAHIFVTAGR